MAETYNPQVDGIVQSKPSGAVGFSLDRRSEYPDEANFVDRPFISIQEVLDYFDTPFKREGRFSVFINATGTLNPDGTVTGGVVEEYWWKDGTADNQLVIRESGQREVKITYDDLEPDKITYINNDLRSDSYTLNFRGIGLLEEGVHYAILTGSDRGFELINGLVFGVDDLIVLSSVFASPRENEYSDLVAQINNIEVTTLKKIDDGTLKFIGSSTGNRINLGGNVNPTPADLNNAKFILLDAGVGNRYGFSVADGNGIEYFGGFLAKHTFFGDLTTAVKPLPAITETGIFIGDSITYGVGASSNQFRYSTLTALRTNVTEVNHGISSSLMQKGTPVNPFAPGINMQDRLSDIPTYVSTMKFLVFEFGDNDIGYNGGDYTPANFKLAYTNTLNNAISKGWPLNKIFLVSPTYFSTQGYAFYAGISGVTAPTNDRHLAYVTATSEVATTLGVNYIDAYNGMLSNGGLSLVIATDGLHPNDGGHTYLATLISNAIGAVTVTKNKLVSNGNGEINGVLTVKNQKFDDLGIEIIDQTGDNLLKVVRNNGNSGVVIGSSSATAEIAPAFLSLGGTFNQTPNDKANAKLKVADGGGANVYGFSVSTDNGMEYFGGSIPNKHTFFGNVFLKDILNLAKSIIMTGATIADATISMGNSVNAAANDPTNAKLKVANGGGANVYGFSVNAINGLEYFAGFVGIHTFFGKVRLSNDLEVTGNTFIKGLAKLDFGNVVSVTPNDPTNARLVLFNGGGANIYGFTVSLSGVEYFGGFIGKHNFYGKVLLLTVPDTTTGVSPFVVRNPSTGALDTIAQNLFLKTGVTDTATLAPDKAYLNATYTANSTTGVGMNGFRVRFPNIIAGALIAEKIDDSTTGNWMLIQAPLAV